MVGLDYNTKLKSEMSDLPFSFYYVDEKHPCYHAPLHWHRSFELVRILKGSLTIFLDTHETELLQGETVIINRKDMHGFSPTDCIYEVIDFDAEKLLSQIRIASQSISVFAGDKIRISPVKPKKGSLLYNSCEHLFTTAENNYSEFAVLGALLEFIGIICSNHYYTECKVASTNSKPVELIKPIISFIEKSFMNNLSLKQMANAGAISVSYMSFLFRSILHQTPTDYLNSYRIERACMLLESSNMPITEVSYNCGFNDGGYFVKVFKKYKSVTPKKYRDSFK